MLIDSECTALITAWEGLPDGDPRSVNLDPYMDPVNIWTIGYGHALRNPATGKFLTGTGDRAAAFGQFPGGITKAQAVAMLAQDLGHEAVTVSALAPTATRAQFGAFVSLNFNIGSLASSTLLKLHRVGAPSGHLTDDVEVRALHTAVMERTLTRPTTILEGFAVWSFSKKIFLAGLFCRRLAEWTMYSGAPAINANAFGSHVRSVIAH